ncbi:MAG TPA: transcriptional regulator NrdR [Persephonella sp.]|uniref:Transcriptional repressor NrdR n=1 Tax=Persephonella marina (strain DSM 14350 / EX-H1) TaxID=123214 RepID=NRDR_PERMH|nr:MULTISPECIES: transcriptional regulator NrdR [Persephonella]C0QQA0.1 RecName: Full=Transcriptional repressor NrdR [Persephonella marina EX-H1]ACO04691.1 transcriptional regulator NrdR [Persephonella marina EX-H1]HCB69548.1 transcriptional regulator NrdR [Persephonella sp.]
MKCPKCGSLNDKVVDTRQSKDGTVIRRRRECLDCGYRFTTYERFEEEKIVVKKKNGTTEPFNKDKIIRGIRLASKNRPVSEKQMVEIADEIEKYLLEEGKLVVESTEIGDLVQEKLKKIDPVSYLRFKSVYNEFQDIKDFEKALKEIEEKGE